MLLTVVGWVLAALFLGAAFVAGYFVLATRRIASQAERLVPPAGRFIDVLGNRIHYVDEGNGPTILMVHGLGGQLHHFRHTLFETLGSDYRLVALDRPGSGYSVRRAGSDGRLSEQADVVAAFISALKLEKPLLVGHSLGGAVTLAVALRHPEAISGIVLLAPASHMEPAVRPAFKALEIRSPLKRRILAHTVAVPTSLKYAPQTLKFIFGPQPVPADYGTAAGGWAGLRPGHWFATCSDFVAIEHDLGSMQERYGEIAMPAGMIFGTADKVLDHELHGLPLARSVDGMEIDLVEGLGHMVQFSATDRVAALIRRVAARAFA